MAKKREILLPAGDDSTPGWDAISEACQRIYPGQEPKHYGTIIKWVLGGNDPLDGISTYKADGPPPHWHFVSYGLTELYDKTSENHETSGWGFELTFRLCRTARESQPPVWAMSFLQNLARYVFQTGNAFGPNHHLDLNGPIALEQPETEIRAIAFTEDPELKTIDTPHGKVQFLQIVGLTADELHATQCWDTGKFLEVMRATNPLLITDLDRESILKDGPTAEAVAHGTRRDGSSQSAVFVSKVGWNVNRRKKPPCAILTIGALGVEGLKRMLAGRLPYERSCWMHGSDLEVLFRPAKQAGWEETDDGPAIDLSKEALNVVIKGLKAERGEYSWSEVPRLTVVVEPSEIKNSDGKVVKVVG
jgi:hypothetical protein